MAYIPNKKRKRVRKPGKNQKFYQSARWKKVSRLYKNQHPICEVSYFDGLAAEAKVTDHIIPIEQGGAEWDERNYMGLSTYYHNLKRRFEQDGFVVPHINTSFGKIPMERMDIIDHLLSYKAKKKINPDGSRG
jgi:hypothetical protein